MANALGVTTHFPCILHKIYNSKNERIRTFLPQMHWCLGLLSKLSFDENSSFFLSCCILNSRREHLPLNWGYKNQNNLQSRYWLNVSVENHSHPPCYFKRERISVDSKLISGTSFEIKASCVLFDKEEFDCLFNIVSFWSR